MKGKAVPIPNEVPPHEDVRGNGGILLAFLNSVLDGVTSTSRPAGHFIPGERNLCDPLTRKLCRIDAVEERKVRSCRG
jgi:hypothetical protein